MKDGTHYRTRAQNFLRENLLIAPGNDLDPSLVHRLEPLSLLLGILVWDGADGVAALALAVGVSTITCGSWLTILSTSISVSARLSSDDRSSHASDGSVSAGANVKAVQRMLGHASAAMTLDVYSGLFDDDLDGVAAKLDLPSWTRSAT